MYAIIYYFTIYYLYFKFRRLSQSLIYFRQTKNKRIPTRTLMSESLSYYVLLPLAKVGIFFDSAKFSDEKMLFPSKNCGLLLYLITYPVVQRIIFYDKNNAIQLRAPHPFQNAVKLLADILNASR